MYGMALLATCASGLLAHKRKAKVTRQESLHGIKFSYSIQKDDDPLTLDYLEHEPFMYTWFYR
jgi:hypothetical protein